MDIVRRFVARRRHRRNVAAATRVGEGSRLIGVVERRAKLATVIIGRNCLIQGQLVAERDESRIELADRVLIGGGTVVDCALSVKIESDVLVSYECIIADSDNHSLYPELRIGDLANWMDDRRHNWNFSAMAPVRICKGAWIGARSIILKGVTIGEGAVIGMGSVVTADIPPRTVAVGNPARVIREVGSPPQAGS